MLQFRASLVKIIVTVICKMKACSTRGEYLNGLFGWRTADPLLIEMVELQWISLCRWKWGSRKKVEEVHTVLYLISQKTSSSQFKSNVFHFLFPSLSTAEINSGKKDIFPQVVQLFFIAFHKVELLTIYSQKSLIREQSKVFSPSYGLCRKKAWHLGTTLFLKLYFFYYFKSHHPCFDHDAMSKTQNRTKLTVTVPGYTLLRFIPKSKKIQKLAAPPEKLTSSTLCKHIKVRSSYCRWKCR